MKVQPSNPPFGCVPYAGYSVLILCYILFKFNLDYLIIAVILSTQQ
jgi:hypothetical protein